MLANVRLPAHPSIFRYVFMNISLGYSLRGVLVIAGAVSSTVSSAIGAVIGAGNVMQALAKDELISALRPFAVGSGGRFDTPRRAMALTCAVSFAVNFAGGLNDIAKLVSNLFLLSFHQLVYQV